jgi:hypothetical protein
MIGKRQFIRNSAGFVNNGNEIRIASSYMIGRRDIKSPSFGKCPAMEIGILNSNLRQLLQLVKPLLLFRIMGDSIQSADFIP